MANETSNGQLKLVLAAGLAGLFSLGFPLPFFSSVEATELNLDDDDLADDASPNTQLSGERKIPAHTDSGHGGNTEGTPPVDLLNTNPARCSVECWKQLAEAATATYKYRKLSRAIEDGFASTVTCVEAPVVGGDGIHYRNLARAEDGNIINVNEPEMLLYEPQENGKMRLVAVEYLALVMVGGQPWTGAADQPPPFVDNPPPVLFGHTFGKAHRGLSPWWHYHLHVWLWRHNPEGTFADWNTRVSCPKQ